LIEALGFQVIASVDAAPVAVVVTTVAQVAEAIALVPSADVPLAINTPKVPAVPVFTAKAVATPVPSPDTPVLMGSPVALVSVPDVGVPRTGVTSVGEVAFT
jgi:hypothetical protein